MRYCEKCDVLTKVIETRDTHKRTVTRRRRECVKCGHRYTTYELRGLAVITTEREYIPVEVDVPTADEIASEVVDQIMGEIDGRLDDLPGDTVDALILEADHRRRVALPAGAVEALDELDEIEG